MPPRKRAESKPADPAIETEPPAEPERAEPAPEPAKSDLRAVADPCAECFPNGWPDLAFGLGCEHGTWSRAATG